MWRVIQLDFGGAGIQSGLATYILLARTHSLGPPNHKEGWGMQSCCVPRWKTKPFGEHLAFLCYSLIVALPTPSCVSTGTLLILVTSVTP